MSLDRRAFLRTSVGAALAPLIGCSAHGRGLAPCPAAPSDFVTFENFAPIPNFEPRSMLRSRRVSGPAVVVLHELPGLWPPDLALGRCLEQQGFTVYLPVLFGRAGQDRSVGGYFQSCHADFECSDVSARSRILDWLDEVCRVVAEGHDRPIGVIGMCLTGAFPLALLRHRVSAAVVCQPTLPFNVLARRPIGAQKSDLGLTPADLAAASRSRVPILALRYSDDSRCPKERMDVMRYTFPKRMALIELAGSGHSTLAGDFNEEAFADALTYLKVLLGSMPGPARMCLARLEDRPCEITADGTWRPL